MGDSEQTGNDDPHAFHRDLLGHKRLVARYLERCIGALVERAVLHDYSKFSPEEYDSYREARPRFAELTYGTEEYRDVARSIEPAIRHHLAENRHHPEHFPDGINGMNLLDLLEMVCDWVAASQRHPGSALRLDLERERFGIDDQLMGIIEHTVDFLQDERA